MEWGIEIKLESAQQILFWARKSLALVEHTNDALIKDSAPGHEVRSLPGMMVLPNTGKLTLPLSFCARKVILRYYFLQNPSSMRIASLSPAATEILFAIGAGKQIVCTDQFSNFPEEAKAIPHVRDMVKIDPEEVRKFQPEAVFLGTSIQTKLAEALRAANFSVIHDDPRSIADIYAWIRSIGTIVNREREAGLLIASMQKGFSDLQKKAKMMNNARAKCRLYIEEWHEPPFTSGNWVPEIARMAGGEQFPVPSGALSPEVTLDQVEKWNPDLIIISWCGAGAFASKELLLNRPGWDRLRAVQKGHVKVIDDSLLNRPGPRLVEGAQRLYGWMFEMLH